MIGILAVSAWGCQWLTPSGEKGVLRVQLTADPVTLDPSFAEDGIALRILHNSMDGLVGYDGEGKLQFRLAESVQLSPDKKRYEFKLRPGIQWSDGTPVRAADFVTALRRALSPGTASKLGAILDPIRNAREVRAGKIPVERLGVAALPAEGDQPERVVFELERPMSYFLQALTLPPAMPLREDILATNSGQWPPIAPSTGPYQIRSYQVEQRLVLAKNPHSFRAADSMIPEVTLQIVREEATAAHLLDQARLDVLTRVPPFEVERLKKEGLIRQDPMVATYFLSFNARSGQFKDRQWRKAVSGAIRRKELVHALGTGEAPARSWIPHGLSGYVPFDAEFAKSFEPAVAAVRAQIQKSKSPKIYAAFDTSGRNAMVMEKVQQDLRVGLGLLISLQNLDWKSYVGQLTVDPPQIYRFGWLAPFMDPISHLQAFAGGDPNNYSGWSNAEYDRLVREIQELEPGEGRDAKILRAQKILVEEEAIVVPIYHYVQTHAVAPRVKNFRVNPMSVIRFEELRLE